MSKSPAIKTRRARRQASPSDDGLPKGCRADAARWALTHDGKPVEKIEIDVGGETKQVSLQEVVKGYAEQEAINQRARQVEEYARTFEQQSTAGRPGDRPGPPDLPAAARIYRPGDGRPLSQGTQLGGGIFRRPEGAPTKRRKSSSTSAAAWSRSPSEMQREQAEAQAQYQAQAQADAQQEAAYAEWGKQEFRRRTGITDTATLNNEYAAMRKVGMEVYGFNEQEIGTVFDPRMLHVLTGRQRIPTPDG